MPPPNPKSPTRRPCRRPIRPSSLSNSHLVLQTLLVRRLILLLLLYSISRKHPHSHTTMRLLLIARRRQALIRLTRRVPRRRRTRWVVSLSRLLLHRPRTPSSLLHPTP